VFGLAVVKAYGAARTSDAAKATDLVERNPYAKWALHRVLAGDAPEATDAMIAEEIAYLDHIELPSNWDRVATRPQKQHLEEIRKPSNKAEQLKLRKARLLFAMMRANPDWRSWFPAGPDLSTPSRIDADEIRRQAISQHVAANIDADAWRGAPLDERRSMIRTMLERLEQFPGLAKYFGEALETQLSARESPDAVAHWLALRGFRTSPIVHEGTLF
jgi:hypothetical protein